MPIKLALATLESFDPAARRRGDAGRFCRPLPTCAGKAKTPAHRSVSVNLRSGAWRCHRCGEGGLLEEYRTRPALDRPAAPPPEDWRRRVQGLQPYLESPAQHYLRSRGITALFPQCSGVLYHPAWFDAGPAVVFPLCDDQERQVAAHGRYLAPGAQPRMRTAGPLASGAFLSPNALLQPEIVICEAPIDALSLAMCGVPALATCGAKNIPTWLPHACLGKRVFLAHDPDTAGNEGARMLCDLLDRERLPSQRLTPLAGDWNAYLQQHGPQVMETVLARAIR